MSHISHKKQMSSLKPERHYAFILGGLFALCSGMALITQGITWALIGMSSCIGLGAGLFVFGALKCYALFQSLHDQSQKTMESFQETSSKVNAKLDYIDGLREELLGPKRELMEILALVKGLIQNLDQKANDFFEPLQAEIQGSIALMNQTLKVFKQSATQLTGTLQGAITESMPILESALEELKGAHLELVQKTKAGVEAIPADIHACQQRVDQILEKVDQTLRVLEKAAQGGSDLLAPARGIGNLVRSIRNFFMRRKNPLCRQDVGSGVEMDELGSDSQEVDVSEILAGKPLLFLPQRDRSALESLSGSTEVSAASRSLRYG